MAAAELLLRQLADATSSTYTYLLADPATKQAVLIDPVFEQARRDAELLRELGLTLVATLDTHVHADHVTAAWLHRQRSGSRIGLAAAAGAEGVDLPLAHGQRVPFGRRHLEVRATPGHTDGCLSFVLDDTSMAFSGDALLILFRGEHHQRRAADAGLLMQRALHSSPAAKRATNTVSMVPKPSTASWPPTSPAAADAVARTTRQRRLSLPLAAIKQVSQPLHLSQITRGGGTGTKTSEGTR
jgi:hypothetical protein